VESHVRGKEFVHSLVAVLGKGRINRCSYFSFLGRLGLEMT
jgi:hypothetical protein